MGKEQEDLISELCEKWGLDYGKEEITRALESTAEKNGNKSNRQAVFDNPRNIEWNLSDIGVISLTGLRGR